MIAVAIIRPGGNFNFFGWQHNFNISQGLDLQGGTYLKYTLDLSKAGNKQQAISGVQNVIEHRINPLGVGEPVIQTSTVGNDTAIIVELPGVKDTQAAINTIGKTAKLTFRESNAAQTDYTETNLSGADLKNASVDQQQTTNAPVINLTFNSDGSRKFADITTRNVGKSLAIYLDDQPLQIATVKEAITGGQAEISGNFNLTDAQNIVSLLKAGALPVPLTLVQQQTIGATLGQDSIDRSLVAGLIGFILVAIFLIAYYRRLGVIAVLALIIYVIIAFAIFKGIPITLTLAGITGFILSIGMAVDANILIFERTKEERLEGKDWRHAIIDGFNRAMSSIRDSNISSIITALILYNFGSSSLVKNFAVTLIIGIGVSLFSAITVSRTLLLLAVGTRFFPIKSDGGESSKRIKASEYKPIPKLPELKQARRSRW